MGAADSSENSTVVHKTIKEPWRFWSTLSRLSKLPDFYSEHTKVVVSEYKT